MRTSLRGPSACLLIVGVAVGTVGCSDPDVAARRNVASMEKQLDLGSIGDIDCRRVIDPTFLSSSPYTVVVAIDGVHLDDAVDRLNSAGYSGSATEDDGGVWNASGRRHVILGFHDASEAGDELDYGGKKPCTVPDDGLTVFELTNQ